MVTINQIKTLPAIPLLEVLTLCCMLANRQFRTEEGKKLCANLNDQTGV